MASARATSNDTTRLTFEAEEYRVGAPHQGSPPVAVGRALPGRDYLPGVLHRLEVALASAGFARGQEWCGWAVAQLREARAALGRREPDDEGSGCLLADLDVTRAGLLRQGLRLCQEQADLVVQIRVALMLVEAAEWWAADDSHIRRRVEQLIEALREHQTEETDLILESVYTELGAGD